MSKSSCKIWYLPFLFCLVLVSTFLFTVPVSADDGQPVDQPAVEEVTSPPQTDAPPQVVEPTEDGPVPAEPVEDPTVQEVTSAVADSDLVLTDSAGVPAPMAARDTSLGVVEGDPSFKVGGVEYTFTHDDCDPGLGVLACENPIQAALDYMESHNLTPTDRKLYIESVDDEDDDYKEDVEVYGFVSGVKGLLALVGKGDSPDDVMLFGTISVYGMPSGFSINNLSVHNDSPIADQSAIYFGGNKGLVQLVDVNATSAGTDGIGIVVTGQTGNVELNRVAAKNNGYHGALLNMTSGTVKITNSEFNHNLQNFDDGSPEFDDYGGPALEPMMTGLRVWSTNGVVTLYGVEASDNGYIDGVTEGNTSSGAMIFARTSTVSVKNSVFNYNGQESGGDGLYIDANIISFDHVVASDNGWNGIKSEINTSFTGNNLDVENNGDTGLSILGCFESDLDVYCDNTGPGTVTIKDFAAVNNGNRGIDVSTKGSITITNAWSGFNPDGSGYYLNNQFAPSPTSITVTNGDAYGNDYGFEIYTRGAVTLTDFSVADNFSTGVLIDANGTGAVTLTNIGTVFNELRKNGGDGYHITSLGPVTIINTDTYDNANLGGYIDNSAAASAAPVTIKVMVSATTANGFWNNSGGGLQVLSRGVVIISNITVQDNDGTGAVINNRPPGTASGVAVTISDSGFFNNDNDDPGTDESGLVVISKGAITLLNVVIFENDGYGVFLDNQVAGSTSGVTINAGTGKGNYFLFNKDDGVVIRTNGAVTLTNINATENGDYGVNIDNTNGTAGVTIKATGTWGSGFDYNNVWGWGNSFSRSGYDGLYIASHGPVSVTVHQARENQDEGIIIMASGGTGAVTITGPTGSFAQIQDNGTDINEDGIHILANGLITLTRVEARGNYAAGAYLINDNGTGGVTLTEVYTDNNYAGLYVSTKGAVVWKTGSASGNYAYGARIFNYSSLLPYKSVIISTVYTTNNGETGLFIESKGAVTLTNVESNNNSANGFRIEYDDLWVDNMSDDQSWYFYGTPGDTVNIDVTSTNFNPWAYVTDPEGNFVDSANGVDGALTLTFNIELSDLEGDYMIHLGTDNGETLYGYQISIYQGTVVPEFTEKYSYANGIMVYNYNGINAPVTITNTYHPWNSNNSGTNVLVMSSGLVTLANMEINDSQQNGLHVNNTFPATATPGVILTDVNFHNNDQIGSYILTDGTVNVKNSQISGNGSFGINIVNNSGTNTAGVTLTSVDVNNSGSDGIYIRSNGSVSLTSVWSSDNIQDGMDIITNGAVTFNNVGAWGNDQYGASVSALGSFTAIQPVYSWNDFSGNELDGLRVFSNGKITLAKVRANDNGARQEDGTPITEGIGIFLYNASNTAGTGLITLTNIETINNTMQGVFVTTTSGITATTIIARYNTSDGVWMNQEAGPAIVPVLTLSDINIDGNGSDGLYVDAVGNIVVNKVVAGGNGGNGVSLSNFAGKGTVSILNTKGTNFAINNGGSGVWIRSNGAVSVTGLEIVGNMGGSGLEINNKDALLPAAITLNSVYSRSNGLFGNWLQSIGVVTVNNSCSIGNGYSGYDIWTPNNVFINNSSALNNNWTGFYINLNPAGGGSLGFTAKLTNSTWYGNLRNPLPGNTNLMVVDGNKVIL